MEVSEKIKFYALKEGQVANAQEDLLLKMTWVLQGSVMHFKDVIGNFVNI